MMYSSTAFAESTPAPDERPRPGDRVKLFGNHRWAGHTGVYIADRSSTNASPRPYVRIDITGEETVVFDPPNQMRKI